MAYSRRSTLDIKQVTGLLEQAGWDIRQGTGNGHLVASKAGVGAITLANGAKSLHKNTVAQVQQAIGVHLKSLLRGDRGKRPSRETILKRIQTARQLRRAGFGSGAIDKLVGLGGFYRYGFRSSQVLDDPIDPAALADQVYTAMWNGKHVKVTHLRPVERDETPLVESNGHSDDTQAMLSVLGDIEAKLGNQSREALAAGRYLERLNQVKRQLGSIKNTAYALAHGVEELETLLNAV